MPVTPCVALARPPTITNSQRCSDRRVVCDMRGVCALKGGRRTCGSFFADHRNDYSEGTIVKMRMGKALTIAVVTAGLAGGVTTTALAAAGQSAPANGRTSAEHIAKEKAAKDQISSEQLAKEKAAKEKAAKDQAAKDQISSEQLAKEKAAKEQAAKDLAATPTR